MRKSTVRQNARRPASRLVPQRPVRKKTFLPRGRSQNSYRRNRIKGQSRKTWLWGLAGVFGIFALAGLYVGLVVGYHHLLNCSLFCIKDINNIEIDGTKRLSPDLVRQQAHLTPGLNLLAVRPGRVERALMAHPWIAKAEVSRRWPDRLHLYIQERDPVALVQIGEELLYVDRQGMLFKPLSPGDPHNFPVITGLGPEQFQPPEGAMSEMVTQAFRLLDDLKHSPPPLNLENISEVHVDLERGFTLYVNGLGAPLELGLSGFADKLQKFSQLWPVLVQKGLVTRVGSINLDYPHRALVSLKGMADNPNE
jgi:cell division protein FtsQ